MYRSRRLGSLAVVSVRALVLCIGRVYGKTGPYVYINYSTVRRLVNFQLYFELYPQYGNLFG
jgi:hypothetical protein